MKTHYVHWRFLTWVAWRYLVNRRGKSGLSMMTTISIVGVTIGVAALIIVLSVMGGFEQDLKEKMLRGQPHVEIVGQNAIAGFSLKQFPLEKIQALVPTATGAESYTQADVALKHGKHLSTAVMFGVDPKAKGHMWGFGDSMKEGALSALNGLHRPLITSAEPGNDIQFPGIVLGEQLAGQLSADIGDEISVITPNARAEVSEGATLTRSYILVGIFNTGLFNYDAKWAVVSLTEGRKFLADYDETLDEQEYVTGVALNVDDPMHIEAAMAKVTDQLKDLKPQTWKQSNAALLFALKLEKFTMGAILMLIVLVAAFSISGTMMMTVFHRKTQICLLRALGLRQSDIIKAFLLQGGVIGGVGVGIGMLAGLIICTLIYILHRYQLTPNIYFLRALPVKFLPVDYAIIAVFALGLALFGAFYPAYMASRQDPSRGLRF